MYVESPATAFSTELRRAIAVFTVVSSDKTSDSDAASFAFVAERSDKSDEVVDEREDVAVESDAVVDESDDVDAERDDVDAERDEVDAEREDVEVDRTRDTLERDDDNTASDDCARLFSSFKLDVTCQKEYVSHGEQKKQIHAMTV
jgi:hypothetical protein